MGGVRINLFSLWVVQIVDYVKVVVMNLKQINIDVYVNPSDVVALEYINEIFSTIIYLRGGQCITVLLGADEVKRILFPTVPY